MSLFESVASRQQCRFTEGRPNERSPNGKPSARPREPWRGCPDTAGRVVHAFKVITGFFVDLPSTERWCNQYFAVGLLKQCINLLDRPSSWLWAGFQIWFIQSMLLQTARNFYVVWHRLFRIALVERNDFIYAHVTLGCVGGYRLISCLNHEAAGFTQSRMRSRPKYSEYPPIPLVLQHVECLM